MSKRLLITCGGSAGISATAGVLAVLHGPGYLILGGLVLLAWVSLNLALAGDVYPHERVVLLVVAIVAWIGALSMGVWIASK